MKKIFLVEYWECGNYEVVYVASTEELAKDFIRRTNPRYEIKAVEIDAPFDKSERNWAVKISILDTDVINSFIAEKRRVENEMFYEDESASIFFIIRSETFTEAEKTAKARMEEYTKEADSKFKYLRTKCVHAFQSYHFFPSYDFITGEILLRDDQTLDSFTKAQVRRIDSWGLSDK